MICLQVESAKGIFEDKTAKQASDDCYQEQADADSESESDGDYDEVPTIRQVEAEEVRGPTIREAARAWDNFRMLQYEMRCWEQADTDEYREMRAVAYFNAGQLLPPHPHPHPTHSNLDCLL